MGIKNLFKIIEKYAQTSITTTKIDKYKNKTIGIDANLLIYQLVYAIRSKGYDIKNDDLIVTHIHSLLLKLKAFVKYKIKAVFVFDSTYPQMKQKELEFRTKTKNKMIEKYKKDKSKEGKRIYYYAKTDISKKEIEDCRQLIDIFGFPIVDALEEADSQLVYLYKKGIIDYIVSQDMDILLFGGSKLLKNFTVNINKNIIEINLKELLKQLKMNQTELIKLGMVLGCDYCEKVEFEKRKKLEDKIKMIKNNQIKFDKQVIDYFVNPPINKIKTIKFAKLDTDRLTKFLYNNKFKKEYIQKNI